MPRGVQGRRATRERLIRIRDEPRDNDGWVFRARDGAGRTTFVQCPKQQRRVAGRRVLQLPGAPAYRLVVTLVAGRGRARGLR